MALLRCGILADDHASSNRLLPCVAAYAGGGKVVHDSIFELWWHCIILQDYNIRRTLGAKSCDSVQDKSDAIAYVAKVYASSRQVAIDMIEGRKGHGFGEFDYR